MLRIDEAERIVAAERSRIRQGEDAIAALKWLENYACDKSMDLAIHCRAAAGCLGHTQAMAYLNDRLNVMLASIIGDAMSKARHDIDRYLGDD